MLTTKKEIRVIKVLKDQRYQKIKRRIPSTRKELIKMMEVQGQRCNIMRIWMSMEKVWQVKLYEPRKS